MDEACRAWVERLNQLCEECYREGTTDCERCPLMSDSFLYWSKAEHEEWEGGSDDM
jgi:predicted amidophosphoribosyltransferase